MPSCHQDWQESISWKTVSASKASTTAPALLPNREVLLQYRGQ